jgi:two-component system cell cycle response regulator
MPRNVASWKGSALIVESDRGIRANLRRALPTDSLRITEARDVSEALAKIHAQPDAFQVVVLDASDSRPQTLETARRLRKSPGSSHLPMVAFANRPLNDAEVNRAVENGVTDFVQLPASPAVLTAHLRAASEQALLVRQLRAELRFARKHATVDELTELGNRRGFEARILEESAFAKRHRQPFALLLLDLDHFKSVNDRFGHEEGDRVLLHFADALRAISRGEDVAFRHGGEEFVLLLRACDAERALDVADRLKVFLETHPFFYPDGRSEPIPFSGGVASALPSEAYAGQDLFARADVALYRAKNTGRSRVYCWEPQARSA